MSKSLSALPPELISHVLADINSLPTLCNLAACSHQLYLCTIPHLYHHVTIREGNRRGVQGYGQLRKLASSLFQKPHLAGLVRRFTLLVVWPSGMSADSSEDFEDLEYSEEPDEPETAMVDQASKTADDASTLSNVEDGSLLGQLSHTPECHHDFILALLLPSLLNVEKVALDLSLGKDYVFLERMMGRAARKEKTLDIQPLFQALTVFVYVHGTSRPRTIGFIASLLKLPAIQKIDGGFGDSVLRMTDKNLIESENRSSPLTSLYLGSYAIQAEDLGHMLRVPKALKNFSYKIRSHAYTTLQDVRHALEPQEDYLETLRLDYDEEWYSGPHARHMWLAVGPMPSFISFNALKIIEIAMPLFYATFIGRKRDSLINIFPPNLETLHLTRFQGCSNIYTLEATEYLVAQKSPQQVPSLKKIIIEGGLLLEDALWMSSHNHALGRLSMVAIAQGVSIENRLHDIAGRGSSYGR